MDTQINYNLNDKNSWVVNLTDIPIPEYVQQCISLGPGFNVNAGTSKNVLFEMMTDVEHIIRENPNKEENSITRNRIANLFHNHIVRNDRNMDQQDKHFAKLKRQTSTFIRDYNNTNYNKIFAIESDKGNRSAIITQSQYETAMEEILDNKTTFKRIRRISPLNETQNKLKNVLSSLTATGEITNETKERLITTHPIHPRIYALPKLHKVQQNEEGTKIPFRPIVTSINSPLVKLSKYLANILKLANIPTKYTIKNTTEFVTKITTIKIPEDHNMISLDIVNMFPTLPRLKIKKAIEKNWNHIKTVTNIKPKNFWELILMCLDLNYFVYKGEFYRQTQGIGMGDPLSSILSQLTMEMLLDEIFSKLQFQPLLCTLYVDDSFWIVPKNQIQHLLNTCNNINESVKFTIESEINNSIPYLDVTVTRQPDQSIRTKFYQKTISTGRLINYWSSQHLLHKTGTVKNLIHRVYTLTSYENECDNDNIILDITTKNNYPKGLVKRLIRGYKHKMKDKHGTQNIINTTTTSTKKYRSIPYIKGLSEKLSKMLKMQNKDLQIAYKNNNGKNFHTRPKDNLNHMKSHIIYEVKCSCNAKYVGLTIQNLKDRMEQHERDMNSAQNSLATEELVNKTELTKHCANSTSSDLTHKFNTEAPRILCNNKNYYKLQMLETLHIAYTDNTVNKRTDTNGLGYTYRSIVDNYKRRQNLVTQR